MDAQTEHDFYQYRAMLPADLTPERVDQRVKVLLAFAPDRERNIAIAGLMISVVASHFPPGRPRRLRIAGGIAAIGSGVAFIIAGAAAIFIGLGLVLPGDALARLLAELVR